MVQLLGAIRPTWGVDFYMSSEYRVPECDGDGAHRPIMMRWRSERNGFWCRRCNLVLAIDEITLQDQRWVTSHNAMRDALCTNYHTLPPCYADIVVTNPVSRRLMS